MMASSRISDGMHIETALAFGSDFPWSFLSLYYCRAQYRWSRLEEVFGHGNLGKEYGIGHEHGIL